MDKCIVNPGVDCLGQKAAALLEHRIEELEKDVSKERDIQAAFRKTYYADREGRIRWETEMTSKLSGIAEKLEKLVSWQEAQAAKPGKRLDGLMDKLLLVVGTALVTYVLAKLGLTA